MNQATETQDNTNQATDTPTAAAGAPKDVSNGVTRPKAGTTCARVWTICDEQSAAANAPAERAKVIEQAITEGINAATVATQHGKWRKYHGLVADSPEAKAEKVAAAAEKAAKAAAEKAAKKEAAAKVKADKAAAKAKAKAKTDAEANVGDVVVEENAGAGDVAADVTAVA